MTEDKKTERARSHKAKWVPPEIERSGNVKELVQGGGKSGASPDGDPQSTTKGGVG